MSHTQNEVVHSWVRFLPNEPRKRPPLAVGIVQSYMIAEVMFC